MAFTARIFTITRNCPTALCGDLYRILLRSVNKDGE